MNSHCCLAIVQAAPVSPLLDLSVASAPTVIVQYDDQGRLVWATCGRDDLLHATPRAGRDTTTQRAA
jgi:hypothetical protein